MYSKTILLFLHVFDLTSAVPSKDPKLNNEDDKDATVPYQLRNINYALICRLQSNGYHCEGNNTNAKFYFDTNMETCMTFDYGECEFSHNQFKTLNECNTICLEAVHSNTKALQNLTIDVICRLQPDSGTCSKYFPMYYYDITTRSCKGFSYRGCGGNFNRFDTELECKAVCNEAVAIPSKMSYRQLK